MENTFNDKALGLSEFIQKKNALRQEFNEILGFDLSSIKNLKLEGAFLYIGLGVTCEYFEPEYLDVARGTPIHFGLRMKTTGLLSWFDSMTSSPIVAVKKDDQWCVTQGGFDKVLNGDVRTEFQNMLRFCEVKVEDLQPVMASSTTPDLKP